MDIWIPFESCSSSLILKKNKSTGQKGLFTTKAFKKDEVIEKFGYKEILSRPSYLTIQKSESEHLVLTPEYIQYLNHSCNPNCFPDLDRFNIVALKDIHQDEELRYFYPSTEWTMDRPFICECNSDQCLKHIYGADQLLWSILSNYQLSHFIEQKKREFSGH